MKTRQIFRPVRLMKVAAKSQLHKLGYSYFKLIMQMI